MALYCLLEVAIVKSRMLISLVTLVTHPHLSSPLSTICRLCEMSRPELQAPPEIVRCLSTSFDTRSLNDTSQYYGDTEAAKYTNKYVPRASFCALPIKNG